MHSQQPPGVVQNWSTLQCSKHNTEQCGYDHAPVTPGRMRTQFPLPHAPPPPPLFSRPPSLTVHHWLVPEGNATVTMQTVVMKRQDNLPP